MAESKTDLKKAAEARKAPLKTPSDLGDNAVRANGQSLTTTKGKILRINKDGSIPTDNPYYNQTTGINRSIWALGFRNPFSFGFNSSGTMFINDVGNNEWEEINVGTAGANRDRTPPVTPRSRSCPLAAAAATLG